MKKIKTSNMKNSQIERLRQELTDQHRGINQPNNIEEEQEMRNEYYVAKEMKNSEAFRYVLAGIGIVGFICLLQAIF